MTHTRNKEKHDRAYHFDNLRFIMIFLVVFAHLLEVSTPFFGKSFIYNTIYSFHMPLSLYLFGYFVKYNPKRIIFHWIIPYVVFQTLYITFCRLVLQSNSTFQYTTPYWLLWYMVACIIYQCLLPIYTYQGWNRILCLGISVCVALLAGFDDSVGYYMSLSRILVFHPWFLLGVYSRENDMINTISKKCSKKAMCILSVISGFFAFLSAFFIHLLHIPSTLLYGSFSYTRCNQTVWMRGAVIMIGVIWLVFLYTTAQVLLNQKLPFITHVGQNALPVFLLHGFIVKATPIFCPAMVNSPLRVLILTCLICVLLGNKWVKKAVYYISLSCLENVSPRANHS